MFAWLKRLAAPVAAIAVLGLSTAANAATIVDFYTIGSFAGSATGSLSNSDATLSISNTGLTYHSVARTLTEVNFDQFGVASSSKMFGYFTIASDSSSAALQGYNGAQFKLTIVQSVPAVGNDSFSSKDVTGSLWYDSVAGSATYGSLLLTFADPLSFSIPTSGDPAAVYTLTNKQVYVGSTFASASSTEQFGIGGQVAVPLPGVAWAGMALLGGLGGWQKLRRRSSAVAA